MDPDKLDNPFDLFLEDVDRAGDVRDRVFLREADVEDRLAVEARMARSCSVVISGVAWPSSSSVVWNTLGLGGAVWANADARRREAEGAEHDRKRTGALELDIMDALLRAVGPIEVVGRQCGRRGGEASMHWRCLRMERG